MIQIVRYVKCFKWLLFSSPLRFHALSFQQYFLRSFLTLLSLDKGVIDFVDFIKIAGKEFKEPLKEEDAQNVFNILNSNTTGFVTSSELYPLLTSFGFELTPTEIDATFKKYGDGLLDYTGNNSSHFLNFFAYYFSTLPKISIC